MTRHNKKSHERHIAEEAAKLLGWCCTFIDHEQPDFIVHGSQRDRFGLELSQIFTGPRDRKGSITKGTEAATRRTLDQLRAEYECATGIPLVVQFVGQLSDTNLKAVLPALLGLNLEHQKPGSWTHTSLDDGRTSLALHICRAIPGHARWYSINDRVGWVDPNPQPRIQYALNTKARKLPIYRHRSGLPDQRLLIYCDATVNSGKTRIMSSLNISPAGFNAVYFFTYPDTVTRLFGESTLVPPIPPKRT